MALDAHKNFAVSLVATAPSPAASGTSLVVTAGEGVRFPAVSFNAVVFPAGQMPTPANAEIVRVTVIATDTFTITRIQESTSARTIVVGDIICAAITLKTLTDIEGYFLPLSGGTMTGFSVWSAAAAQSGNAFLGTAETNTGTGTLQFQAGGGSGSFGGGLALYAQVHATKPGWVVACIGGSSGGKFAVNTNGVGTGTNVFTVDATGAMVVAGTVTLSAYTGTTFAAGDKYLVVDASGNVHRSALGPAS